MTQQLLPISLESEPFQQSEEPVKDVNLPQDRSADPLATPAHQYTHGTTTCGPSEGGDPAESAPSIGVTAPSSGLMRIHLDSSEQPQASSKVPALEQLGALQSHRPTSVEDLMPLDQSSNADLKVLSTETQNAATESEENRPLTANGHVKEFTQDPIEQPLGGIHQTNGEPVMHPVDIPSEELHTKLGSVQADPAPMELDRKQEIEAQPAKPDPYDFPESSSDLQANEMATEPGGTPESLMPNVQIANPGNLPSQV